MPHTLIFAEFFYSINSEKCTGKVPVNYCGLAPLFQVLTWKQKLPLQTIMRMLQVLVPQVEKICIDK